MEEKLRQRGMDPAAVLKDFREVDTNRRQAITEAETSKAVRNKASEEIAKLKKSGQDASSAMTQSKELREKIAELEKAAADLDGRLREILAGIPNLPHASVPVGHSAEDNVEVRRWGTPPKFDFEPKAHWDLGESSGFSIWSVRPKSPARDSRSTGVWARSSNGRSINFMLDVHTREHGYTEVLPPFMVNSEACMAPVNCRSSRGPVQGIAWGRRLLADPDGGSPGHESLPRRSLEPRGCRVSCAYTPCFRSEAGS